MSRTVSHVYDINHVINGPVDSEVIEFFKNYIYFSIKVTQNPIPS